MAYDRKMLQRIGPQNRSGPSIFTFYDSGSTVTAIDASGYFNDASDILKVGDLIYARGSNGYGLGVITGNTRDLTSDPVVQGVVDMTNLLAVGAIDSD